MADDDKRRWKGTKDKDVGTGERRRGLSKRVKTARGRKISSTIWLQRQLNDPYVQRAKEEGWRSRAAYKLIELDERFELIKPGTRVVDLGSAPGGWTQVAIKRGARSVAGIDLLDVEPIDDAVFLKMDFLDDGAPEAVLKALGGPTDLVLSDMAANTTGHKSTDHLRVVALAESAAYFAIEILNPGGAFVAKVFQGGAEGSLLKLLKTNFAQVKHVKPKSSRSGSPETYVIALGFRKRG
ncbi:MAG: rRNA methyltransferase [Robiginitomaculum sp.]|nr:MAG: rRNA methyltransferase [Robiginitomaculum sp.]